LWRNPDLAAQSAVGEAPCGRFVQRKIFILAYRVQFRQPALIDINMASGANSVSSALGHNPAHAMANGLVHDARIVVGINTLDTISGMNERYPGHLSFS
jgi:hypothetical protein